MTAKPQTTVIKAQAELLAILPQVVALADSAKDALGFWPETALREAINRKRLFAMVVDATGSPELVGYVHYSGVFPHAKIQQIAVVPKFRRAGAAAALMNTLVSDLENIGYLTVKAEVASNLSAPLKFYPKNGFVHVKTRAGGQARKRDILIHVRELDTESLFSIAARNTSLGMDLGIRRRSAGEDPFYSFDLNVFFDLARERSSSVEARQLFGAALAHIIRLTVADEFVKELVRTTTSFSNDPILQMAMQLPRLPGADARELAALTDKIHDLVFVQTNSPAAGNTQSLSDARHLAHAALARASAFVTRDGTLLNARNELLRAFGIDVIALDELIALLPHETHRATPTDVSGIGFECGTATLAELKSYLSEIRAPQTLTTEFCAANCAGAQSHIEVIREAGKLVAVGHIRIPRGMEPTARMLVHVQPEQLDADMFADYLLDALTRWACSELATTIELAHFPGQTTINSLARGRGFVRKSAGQDFNKIALGKPLTGRNWSVITPEIRRRTGLTLPAQMPDLQTRKGEIEIYSDNGAKTTVGAAQLEDILSPAIIIWPGRDGVIAPIECTYANNLLGTNPQSTFAFVANRDAAFLSRRAYVNSPRTTHIMRPETPILFYESKRSGGRGAVIAVARIVDAVVTKKGDIPSDRQRRLVVDNVDGFSATDDVLVTTFDNLLALPSPVPFKELKKIDAIGGANLVSAVSLTSEKITKILTQGWPGDKTK
jgi:GNAT superfamily N-acetyltransferase/predicted nucleic acid-binding protein